jgi:hypothetical protein
MKFNVLVDGAVVDSVQNDISHTRYHKNPDTVNKECLLPCCTYIILLPPPSLDANFFTLSLRGLLMGRKKIFIALFPTRKASVCQFDCT